MCRWLFFPSLDVRGFDELEVTLACATVQLAPAVKSSNSLTSQFQDVNCVTWNPSERGLLASASDDGSVKLWQLQP